MVPIQPQTQTPRVNGPLQIWKLKCHCLFAGELGKAPAAVADSLPVPEPEPAADVDDEGEVEDMQARLEALRS